MGSINSVKAQENELVSIKNKDEINAVFGKNYVITHAYVVSSSEMQAEMKARMLGAMNLVKQLTVSGYKIKRNPDSSILRDTIQGNSKGMITLLKEVNKLEDGTYVAKQFNQLPVESETDMSKAVIFSKVFSLSEYSDREVSKWIIRILNTSNEESLLKSTTGLQKMRLVYSSDNGFVLPEDPKDFKTDGKSVKVYAAFWPSN
jgi:tellurite resistance protein